MNITLEISHSHHHSLNYETGLDLSQSEGGAWMKSGEKIEVE